MDDYACLFGLMFDIFLVLTDKKVITYTKDFACIRVWLKTLTSANDSDQVNIQEVDNLQRRQTLKCRCITCIIIICLLLVLFFSYGLF